MKDRFIERLIDRTIGRPILSSPTTTTQTNIATINPAITPQILPENLHMTRPSSSSLTSLIPTTFSERSEGEEDSQKVHQVNKIKMMHKSGPTPMENALRTANLGSSSFLSSPSLSIKEDEALPTPRQESRSDSNNKNNTPTNTNFGTIDSKTQKGIAPEEPENSITTSIAKTRLVSSDENLNKEKMQSLHTDDVHFSSSDSKTQKDTAPNESNSTRKRELQHNLSFSSTADKTNEEKKSLSFTDKEEQRTMPITSSDQTRISEAGKFGKKRTIPTEVTYKKNGNIDHNNIDPALAEHIQKSHSGLVSDGVETVIKKQSAIMSDLSKRYDSRLAKEYSDEPKGNSEPTVTINIGRIEVRAMIPSKSSLVKLSPPSPALSLKDYLLQRGLRRKQ
jgi:hypothetical protein